MIVYYIYAPKYVPTSAGICALYKLACDLRAAGQKAWIVTHADHTQDQLPQIYEELVLSYEMAIFHRYARFLPIVIYPETVHGNPLRAAAVVRYIMNVPGLLGGPSTYAETDCLYAFSETLADRIGKPDWSLFIPLVDETKFTPGNKARVIDCVYASKYRYVHKSVPTGFPAGAIEISRDLHDSPDSIQLIELLRKARTVYLYENTAIAIEAALCGALVVFKPNPYLEFSIGEKDHGNAGMAWGDDPAEIARASQSLSGFREAWQNCKARYPQRLKLFIERTQAYRAQIASDAIDWDVVKPPNYSNRAATAAQRMMITESPRQMMWKAMRVLFKKGPFAIVFILVSMFTRKRPE